MPKIEKHVDSNPSPSSLDSTSPAYTGKNDVPKDLQEIIQIADLRFRGESPEASAAPSSGFLIP